MNKLNLVIENNAENDLIYVLEYISKDNKRAAQKLIKNFYKSFELICQHPNIGKERKFVVSRNVRFYVVCKHYVIIYIQKENAIHILRVLSSCQDICSLLQADLCYNFGYEETV